MALWLFICIDWQFLLFTVTGNDEIPVAVFVLKGFSTYAFSFPGLRH